MLYAVDMLEGVYCSTDLDRTADVLLRFLWVCNLVVL